MGLTVNVVILFHGGFEVVCYLIKSSTFASHIMYVLNSNKEDFKSKKRKKKEAPIINPPLMGDNDLRSVLGGEKLLDCTVDWS